MPRKIFFLTALEDFTWLPSSSSTIGLLACSTTLSSTLVVTVGESL